MDLQTFVTSVKAARPPDELTVHLQALWHAGKGNWDQAHELVQDLPDRDAAHIHAYLHRVEGDQWNADYWYRRAGEKSPAISLEAEWEQLVSRFLTTTTK
ncbi:hypothetical protein [Chitinophaga sp. HK235]|uniref:hypothetical protein n=1 Tax=Chitinophaga sp. HK235 TaxID=2952571 RepID=UPI001BACC287|nr:hypothetical protein [Chitinophaga sp. HK235]